MVCSSAGMLAGIVLAGQGKGIDFVVSDSRWDISITGSPVEGAVHDGWTIDYCAAAREIPEDASSFSAERVHLS